MEITNSLPNVGNYHLKVHYDQSLDHLVYDRKIERGPGDAIYGLEVAKYVIQNPDFINTAMEVRSKIMDKGLLPSTQQSRYNPDLFIGNCKVCEGKGEHTHHIMFQSWADKDGLIGFSHKNRISNLVVLCHKCHHKVHSGDIWISGYSDTSNGPMLEWGEKDDKSDNIEDSHAGDGTDSAYADVADADVADVADVADGSNVNSANCADICEYVNNANNDVNSRMNGSDDSNTSCNLKYNDICKNDGRTYLVNKNLTKYHIKDPKLKEPIPVCRRKGHYEIFEGFPSIFAKRMCQKCLSG